MGVVTGLPGQVRGIPMGGSPLRDPPPSFGTFASSCNAFWSAARQGPWPCWWVFATDPREGPLMQTTTSFEVWQALTPPTLMRLARSGGWSLQTSSEGDAFALLKLSPAQAVWAARTVWQRFFPVIAIINARLPVAAVRDLPIETIAYDDQREYRLDHGQLSALSLAMQQPAQVRAWSIRPDWPAATQSRVAGMRACHRSDRLPATPGEVHRLLTG